jgi:hypothetical protein
MLYSEITAVYSQIHTKHINTAVWAERRIAERFTYAKCLETPIFVTAVTVTANKQRAEANHSLYRA